MKKLLFLLIPFASLAQTNSICFNAVSTLSVGSNPEDITTADFNSDGKIDIVVTNGGSNNISVLLGLGTGVFTAAVNYTTGSSPQGVTVADFNNDGKVDLAVTNNAGNTISILMGTGTGSFLNTVNYPASNPIKITAGDFNSDGNTDLAVANYGSNKVSVLMGSPTGTFATSINYSVGNQPTHVSCADFNNDGKLDIAVNHFVSTFISVLLNSGTGTFGAATNYSTGFNNGSTIICRDFDGDAQIDILSGSTGRFHFFKGTGVGTFSTVVTNIASSQPYSIVSKDFNGDGIYDLVTGEGGSLISTYTISPSAVMVSVGNYSTSVGDYSSVATNDFNNDGKFDIAVASYGTDVIRIFLNGLPNVQATLSATTICIGNTSTITASGANTYSWSSSATTNSITVTPTVTTTYTLTGNGLNGCAKTITTTVAVNQLPIINVVSSNTLLCVGQTASLTASGATNYLWNTFATSNIISITPTLTTTYTVAGTDANGCNNVSTIVQNVSTCTDTESTIANSQSVALLYPNPSNGIITIELKEPSLIIINNTLGQTVYSEKLIEGLQIIDIQNKLKGLYFVTIRNENNQQTVKLITK